MEVVPTQRWEAVIEEVVAEPGVTMILGNVDSGKSTFARFLTRAVTERGRTTGLIDADVGQSSLGLPGTVSAALFTAPPDDKDYRCSRFSFVGTANPAHAVRDILNATATFVKEMKKMAFAVVVDTGGLITGRVGVGFKLAKIRVIQPDRIIAFQRNNECEDILSRLDEVHVERLAPSPYVTPRNRVERAHYRWMKMKDFLQANALTEHLLPESAELIRLGRTVSRHHADLAAGTVVGLNHGNETVDIGIVAEAGMHPIIACRLGSLKGIDRIVFGDLTIAEN